MRLGLISDTHGFIPPVIHTVFAGVDAICHAGDISGDRGDVEELLAELSSIGPVRAVSGNVDGFELSGVPRWSEIETPCGKLGITHRALEGGRLVSGVDQECRQRQLSILVYGHTHSPAFFDNAGVYWVNPGSAGQASHGWPLSAAVLTCLEMVLVPTVTFFDLETGAKLRI